MRMKVMYNGDFVMEYDADFFHNTDDLRLKEAFSDFRGWLLEKAKREFTQEGYEQKIAKLWEGHEDLREIGKNLREDKKVRGNNLYAQMANILPTHLYETWCDLYQEEGKLEDEYIETMANSTEYVWQEDEEGNKHSVMD